ncbi:hypothetical protein [Sphaerisporangium rhizosphaerae]|uniref:Uncharacterized protein n=1 Tax=Sphaerisporangium rhizosphaerae TaxID=2269375 RepID=A0ABW2P188_9ACTN
MRLWPHRLLETKVGLAVLVRAAMPEQAYGLPGIPVPDPGERVQLGEVSTCHASGLENAS